MSGDQTTIIKLRDRQILQILFLDVLPFYIFYEGFINATQARDGIPKKQLNSTLLDLTAGVKTNYSDTILTLSTFLSFLRRIH